MGAPFVERAPGLCVSHDYGDIAQDIWSFADRTTQVTADLPELAIAAGRRAGLEYQCALGGRNMQTEDGRIVARKKIYAICPLGEETKAVDAMVTLLLEREGHGLWWSTGDAVGYRRDDQGACVAAVAGIPHVILAMYYFVDPTPDIDGVSSRECLLRYQRLQRDEPVEMTRAQREHASKLWTRGVRP
jgi:hypothetical protein